MGNRNEASSNGPTTLQERSKGKRRTRRGTRSWVRIALVYCASVIGSGCLADPVEPVVEAAGGALRGEIPQGAVEADLVARSLALAMNAPRIRSLVRDAMRASIVTEHKLQLQEFARTESGVLVMEAASQSIGMSGEAFQRLLDELPLLDFYVPSAADRMNWRGEGNIIVAAALGTVLSRVTGTRIDGARQLLRGMDRSSHGATFLLQAAERKSRRIHGQRAGPGLSIQDPDDGQISGSFVEYLPDGTMRVTELADFLGLRPRFTMREDEGGGGGGGELTVDTTYLEHVIIIGVCDNGDCSQGNEFEWHTYFSSDSGATYGSRFDLRVEGVPSNFEGTWHYPALLKKVRYLRDVIKSDVVETDYFSSDDHFDPSPTWGYFNNGALVSEGDLRCGWPKYYGGTYECDLFIWREVNQSMKW